MFNNIRKDLPSFTNGGDFYSKLKCILISHVFHMVVFYRAGVVIATNPLFGALLRVLMVYLIRAIYASYASLKSKIGPSLMILHGHDIA